MRRLPGRTKLFIGSWYIGAGNKPSVISQTPNKAFAKIREAYREKASSKFGVSPAATPIKFTEKDREEIRHAISKRYRKQLAQKVLITIISIAITAGILALLAFLLKSQIQSLPL